MQRFACTHCGQDVYFHNVKCERCGHALGFDPDKLAMLALEANAAGFHTVGVRPRRPVRYCANYSHGTCNWLVATGGTPELCRACELNRTIPNLSSAENIAAWAAIERAKKQLVYALLRFGLPIAGRAPGVPPLQFDFLANATTGHLNGVITIDIAEADAVERERQRTSLSEPYRSVLGHLRHESAHYFWMLLIDGGPWLEPFRRRFGDERVDYAAALARHQSEGAPPDWMDRHVSAYASAHPWEDWAETWAHYLHIVEALDTALALGVKHAAWPPNPWLRRFDAFRSDSIEEIMKRWIPLSLAMNGLNRSMGHNDFYPFVISPGATEKLGFVGRVVTSAGRDRPHLTAPRSGRPPSSP